MGLLTTSCAALVIQPCLVDVGLGEHFFNLAVKWIWISTTEPQEAEMGNMFPNNNHACSWGVLGFWNCDLFNQKQN